MFKFRRTPKPTQAEEFSNYVTDLAALTKLREKAMQLAVLQPSDEHSQEVVRYSVMIECAQKSIIRITERIENKR